MFFSLLLCEKRYSKNLCKKAALKKTINWFSRPVIAYCRSKVLQNAAILPSFIKLPFVIKIFVLSIFEWPFYTGTFRLYAYNAFRDIQHK